MKAVIEIKDMIILSVIALGLLTIQLGVLS